MKKTTLKKSLLLFALVIFCTAIVAQERAELWHFQLFQTGKISYQTKRDSGTTTNKDYARMAHPTLELLYEDESFYINGNGLAILLDYLFSGSPAQTTNYPAFEFGWGWQLNTDHPLKLGSNTDLLFGLGFNLGVSNYKAFGPPKINSSPVYIGPTFGLNLQMGDRFNIQNVVELNIFKEGKTNTSGSRVELRSNINYRILKGFSLSIIPTLQTYRNRVKTEGTPSANMIQSRKVRMQFLQFGFGVIF